MSTSVFRRIRQWFARGSVGLGLVAGLALAAPGVAQAKEFLSIKGKIVNIRAQPNTKAEIAWELVDGYPLQVVERRGQWVKVKDFESTLGWVHRPLTSKEAHYLVKAKTANLRAQPTTQSKVVTKLSQYDIVKTLEKRNGWAKVKTASGKQGWMSQKLGWGW